MKQRKINNVLVSLSKLTPHLCLWLLIGFVDNSKILNITTVQTCPINFRKKKNLDMSFLFLGYEMRPHSVGGKKCVNS